MDRLEETYGADITFVLLDWDDRDLNPIRQRFDITGRTQYVLVDRDGTVVQRWFGLLDYEMVSTEIESFLNG